MVQEYLDDVVNNPFYINQKNTNFSLVDIEATFRKYIDTLKDSTIKLAHNDDIKKSATFITGKFEEVINSTFDKITKSVNDLATKLDNFSNQRSFHTPDTLSTENLNKNNPDNIPPHDRVIRSPFYVRNIRVDDRFIYGLNLLKSMGFKNNTLNYDVLKTCGNDVNLAAQELL